MALLPDPVTAGLYALATFLVVLGVLVVFVESIRLATVAALLTMDVALALFLVFLGEFGVALVLLGFGGALLANHVFEWLTTR